MNFPLVLYDFILFFTLLSVKITPNAGTKWKGMLLIAKRADPSLNQNEAIGTFTPIANTAAFDCADGGVIQPHLFKILLINDMMTITNKCCLHANH